jgi:hypothetical protein
MESEPASGLGSPEGSMPQRVAFEVDTSSELARRFHAPVKQNSYAERDWLVRLAGMDADEIANQLVANATALHDEVATLGQHFARKPTFLGDSRNFPHAHYGYLMACMGQIDVMSVCAYGRQGGRGEQAIRLRRYLNEFMHPGKTEEHRVAVQLMRNTLMHAGALRPVYDQDTRIVYTWQVLFGTFTESDRTHYSVSVEQEDRQQETLAAAASRGFVVEEVRAFNLRIVLFASDVLRAAKALAADLRTTRSLGERCVREYPRFRCQSITDSRET